MKINWGTALVIFFTLYIATLVSVVIKSRSIDHALVVENYYDHDISYQKKVDKINNRSFLHQDLAIDYHQQRQTLQLSFGDEGELKTGRLDLYRASDKRADFSKHIAAGANETTISLPNLKQGKWTIKVEWTDADRTYLKEQDIYIVK